MWIQRLMPSERADDQADLRGAVRCERGRGPLLHQLQLRLQIVNIWSDVVRVRALVVPMSPFDVRTWSLITDRRFVRDRAGLEVFPRIQTRPLPSDLRGPA